MHSAELAALNVPFVSLSVALGIVEALVDIGPVRDTFTLEHPLRTNHQHALAWSRMLTDDFPHPLHIGALVRCCLEIHTEPLGSQRGNVNYRKMVVMRLR